MVCLHCFTIDHSLNNGFHDNKKDNINNNLFSEGNQLFTKPMFFEILILVYIHIYKKGDKHIHVD